MSGENLSFPGVGDAVGLHAVRTLGVYPDKSILWFNPTAQVGPINGYGNLVFGNNGQNVTFYNCQADSITYRASIHGHTCGLVLLDRRWVWKFARISGAYNIVGDDGVVGSPKNPQELATLLLTACGEAGFDVSVLPTDGNLPVIWDYTEAPLALAWLCKYYGCDVALKLDNTIAIVQLNAGSGPSYPTDVESISVGADPAQLPENLRFIAGDTVIECKIKLEAVGEDTDGVVKPENDLSFKPAGGWGGNWVDFTDVADESERALAARDIGRRYRIKTFVDGTLEVPGLGITLDDIFQILPLKPHRLATLTSTHRPARPALGGFFWIEADPPRAEVPTDFTELHEGFTVDEGTGEVLCTRAQIKLDGSGKWVPAELYLTIAFTVTYNTLVREREERTLAMGGPFGEFVVREDSIYRRIVVNYDPADPLTETTTDDNQTDVDDAGDAILADVATQFADVETGAIVYRTTLPIDSSGYVRQVMWTVSTENGFSTFVSLACDGLPYVRKLAERELWRLGRQSIQRGEYESLKRQLTARGLL
jgi:hypothetical protein